MRSVLISTSGPLATGFSTKLPAFYAQIGRFMHHVPLLWLQSSSAANQPVAGSAIRAAFHELTGFRLRDFRCFVVAEPVVTGFAF